jgi:hypothetical protein
LKKTYAPGDIKKLTPVFGDDNEGKLFDVKQEIYRLPDRMIYNLGMYYGIDGNSAWNIIDKLREKKIINDKASKNLQKAVTFATTLRLDTYNHNEGQRDEMSTFEFALDHMNAEEKEKFIKQTFYIKDTNALHEFYYTMLRVIEIEKTLCSPESRKEAEISLKNDNLYFFLLIPQKI